MKDYYQEKKDEIMREIQAAKVLRKNPNSSMKTGKNTEKESRDPESLKEKEKDQANEMELAKIEEKLNKVDADFDMVLDMQSDALLNKLISFESMMMDESDTTDRDMKEKLYELFFNWKQDSEEIETIEETNQLTEEEKQQKEKSE